MIIFQNEKIIILLKTKYSDLGKASTQSLADYFTSLLSRRNRVFRIFFLFYLELNIFLRIFANDNCN